MERKAGKNNLIFWSFVFWKYYWKITNCALVVSNSSYNQHNLNILKHSVFLKKDLSSFVEKQQIYQSL